MFFVVVEYNNGNHINSNTEQLFWCWKVCKESLLFYYLSQQTVM